MLCYRCGSHVPETSESCGTCGQKLAGGGVRQATATFSRKRPNGGVEGAPYKAGDLVAGRYEIRDAVGAGPVGVVFRAHDREVDVDVALKVVNARLVQTLEERKQFGKQQRTARKLSHQNLIRVYEEGEDEGRPWYTMQYVEGLTLRKIIDLRVTRGEFFKVAEIEPILGQIASALEGAHRLGAHANLKPENVIVLPDLLKVGDFGLSLGIPRLPFLQAVRQRKADRYLPPEYSEGGEVDPRADIYALGVIVGEMLSGLTPDGAVPELARHNPEVPPQLEGLYRRALNSNPLARPKSPGEFFDTFAEIARRVSPPPLRSRAESEPGTAPPRRRSPSVEKPPPPVPDVHLSDEAEIHTDGNILPGPVTLLDAELPSSPPQPRATDETLVMPTLEPTLSRSRPGAGPRRTGVLFLTVFTFAGLALGAAGGYWLLGRTPPPVAVTPFAVEAEEVPTPVVATPETKPAEPTPAIAETPPEVKPAALKTKKPEPRPAVTAKPAAPPPVQVAKVEPPAPAEPPSSPPAEAPPKAAAVVASVEPAAAVAAAPKERGCPDDMKLVDAGPFRMGTARDDPMMGFDEKVLRSVEVGAFCVDVFEYPNKRGASPKVNVSFTEAKRLCEARGKRLCSEEEWEKTCKGPGSARYPYGNTFDADACNTEDAFGNDRALASSGRFPKCRSGYGVVDLSGNVAEWTDTPYAANADLTLKGGSFSRPDYAARCSARKNGSPGTRGADVGFRCCSDLP